MKVTFQEVPNPASNYQAFLDAIAANFELVSDMLDLVVDRKVVTSMLADLEFVIPHSFGEPLATIGNGTVELTITNPVLTAEQSGLNAQLSWTPLLGGEDPVYTLYRQVAGGEFEVIYTGTDLEFLDEDVETGIQYTYRVDGIILVDVHSSNEAELELVAVDPPSTPTLTLLPDDEPELSWTASTPAGGDTLEGYQVWRSVNGGAFALLTETEDLDYVDTSVDLANDYDYYIVGVGSLGGPSTPSNTETVDELIPTELEFTNETVTYDEVQPAALIDAVETFTTDTGQFTVEHFASDPEGTLVFTGGKGEITTPGGFSSTMCINTEHLPTFPQNFVSVDIDNVVRAGGAGYLVVHTGLFYDGANSFFAEVNLDSSRNITGWALDNIVGGVVNVLASSATPITGPVTKLGFGQVGNTGSAWVMIGGVWQILALTSTPHVDFTPVGAMTGWHTGVAVWSDAAGSVVTVDNLTLGRMGGNRIRDQNWVFNEDGTPYVNANKLYYTGTVIGGAMGVFTLDMDTFAVQQVGAAMVARGGSYKTDINLSIVLMEDGTAKACTATWGNGFAGSILIQLHELADWAILSEMVLLTSPTTLTLPGLLTGSYGAYDPSLIWDGTRWIMGYSITENTNFSGNFYPAMAYSDDLSTWVAIGQDTGTTTYEGSKLSRHRNHWYLTSGGPTDPGNIPRVYDAETMAYVGGVDVDLPSGTTLPKHPPMVAVDQTVYFISFDNTQLGGIGFTQGNLLLRTAPRFE